MPSSPPTTVTDRSALAKNTPNDAPHVYYGASVRSGSSSKSKSTARPSLANVSVYVTDELSPSKGAPNGIAPSPQGRPVSFIAPVHTSSQTYHPTLFNTTLLFASQLLSFFVSALFLNAVVLWALLADLSNRLILPAWLPCPFLRRKSPLPVKPVSFPWDDPARWRKEKCTKDVRYYARSAGEGYDIVDEEVETEDGFYLRCVLS